MKKKNRSLRLSENHKPISPLKKPISPQKIYRKKKRTPTLLLSIAVYTQQQRTGHGKLSCYINRSTRSEQRAASAGGYLLSDTDSFLSVLAARARRKEKPRIHTGACILYAMCACICSAGSASLKEARPIDRDAPPRLHTALTRSLGARSLIFRVHLCCCSGALCVYNGPGSASACGLSV